MKDRNGSEVPVTYSLGYVRGAGEEVRLLNPYMGETFATLKDAKEWVAEEEHERYMAIVYFEVRPVETAPKWTGDKS